MTNPISRIPAAYLSATFRNSTPIDPVFNEMGVGFNMADGTIIRLRLNVEHARAMAESVGDYLRDHFEEAHSCTSSGIPSVDVSMPDE